MKKLMFCLVLLICIITVQAQQWTSGQLIPEDNNSIYTPGSGFEFGTSVAGSGDYLFVGSLHEEVVIYYYNESTDLLETYALLQSPDGGPFDYFGSSVDIDGTTAVVGAFSNNGRGAAYVYVLNGGNWVFDQKLTASDGVSGDAFGRRLAISGESIVIGDKNHNLSGAVYLFKRSNSIWSEYDMFIPADAGSGDGFGGIVDIDGEKLLSVSSNAPIGGGLTGAAYVLVDNGTELVLEQKLIAEDASLNDFFGLNAAVISGDNILVGASGSSLAGLGAGAVHRWKYDGSSWLRYATILPEDPEDYETFGYSVAIDSDKVFIGAPAYSLWTGRLHYGIIRDPFYFPISTIAASNKKSNQFQDVEEEGASFGDYAAYFLSRLFVTSNYGSTQEVAEAGTVESYIECNEFINPNLLFDGTTIYSQELDGDEYLWYHDVLNADGDTVSEFLGQNAISYTPTETGIYVAIILKADCRIVTYRVNINQIVGTDENVIQNISVFPNPVSDRINISSNIINGSASVYSLEGKMLLSQEIRSKSSVSVSKLKRGVYLLLIKDEDKLTSVSKKFVKLD
ncbi:MAG: T9SS type A sorting domain-containing protein [Chlorobi bacterium]|nr:T9SS type A sorting domain-containing protein [Chlorobiota bacterium]